MAKQSAVSKAIEKVDAEVRALMEVRRRLIEADSEENATTEPKPKRGRKRKAGLPNEQSNGE